MKNINKKSVLGNIRQAVSSSVVLMIVCGFVFPLMLTGIGMVFFPDKADGSLVYADGEAVGSSIIGQDFTQDYYMKCRPSAYNYNTYIEKDGKKTYNDGQEYAGLGSGSNNYSATNPELKKRVEKDMEEFLKANPGLDREDIPTDLLTASGSGLDPHISVESAMVQIPAIAEASGIDEGSLKEIVHNNTKGKLLGIFGNETVNVLGVNLEIAQAMGKVESVEK